MKPIGLFFGKIFGGLWNWIKETAWVQPLLIVGSIFSIIFSIPTITEWVNGIAESINSPESYYRNFQMKLTGDGEGEDAELNSDAQKLIDAMMKDSVEFGEKFMLVFVQVECQFCKDAQPALKELVENTSRYYGTQESGKSISEVNPEKFGTFKFYTIFTDETYDFPEDTTTTPFERFLQRNANFLEKTADVARNSSYKVNNQLTDLQIDSLESGESNSIPTPTVIMYDTTYESDKGISELLISIPGANFYDKAVTLSDAWMHRNLFELS
jgi:thiol-disulfide isomerase/thioredoxin